jgi:transcriptional regulator
MYQPPHFREDRIEVQHALIRAQSLGLLITAGRDGLQANPLPFLIDAGGSERGTLRAHLARANPQWLELAAVDECLVVFQGPQQYISPSLYATKHEHGKVVPTWNYITVHAWGRPQVIDDVAWLRRQVNDLTLHKEGSRPAPWYVSDAPEPFVAAQLKGIVGIEIPIARIEGKWKVSQNRPAGDQAGVIAGLRGSGDDAETMASLVAERSSSRP